MTAKENGELAAFSAANERDYAPGLTKRELIAAMAMQGFAAAPGDSCPNDVAAASVEWADRLLVELAKPADAGKEE